MNNKRTQQWMKMTVRKKWYKIENKILKKRNGKHENENERNQTTTKNGINNLWEYVFIVVFLFSILHCCTVIHISSSIEYFLFSLSTLYERFFVAFVHFFGL